MNELSPNSFILGIDLPLAALFLPFLGKKKSPRHFFALFGPRRAAGAPS